MDLQQTLAHAQDAMTVKRVYGEPYERDELTIIPAAAVRGGGGGGEGGTTTPATAAVPASASTQPRRAPG